ncbi:hypothetical protein F5050DRAFT_1715601 [Lentinula boryana]|uniref:Cytochrome P450 n=1 Tax=Lentinula boryana TaxID=40481 RepID=A0ABQ8Q087_9AGAR|nr:hypothetical protein F5050DRAFT_1715601 [Lentinula boryana]
MNIPDIITLIAHTIIGGYLLQKRLFCQHQKLVSDIVKGLPCHSWVFDLPVKFKLSRRLLRNETALHSAQSLTLETRLVISDPAAFKFFFQNPYKFSRPPLDTLSSDLIDGSGAVFSEIGPSHRRLRGVMDLAFRKYASSFQEGTDAALGKFSLTESMHAVLGETPEPESKKHTAQKMFRASDRLSLEELGWRLSILLMQTFLTRCLAKVRFKLVDNVGIRPIAFTIFPALDNDKDGPSPNLPLGIEML